MIEAAELRAEPVPRSAALCRRGVAWMESRGKIALFALGYAWLATMPAGAIIGMGVALGSAFVDKPPLPAWYVYTLMTVALLSYAAAWVPFVRRIKRWRAEARALFERGAVVEAPMTSSERVPGARGGEWQRATFVFEQDGRGHTIVIVKPRRGGRDPFGEGLTATLLFEPSAPYCVVYGIGPRPMRHRRP